MLRILQKIMQQGTVTEDYFMSAVPARFRGQLEVRDQRCKDCQKCIDICPTQAIRMKKSKLAIDHDACIFCGACVDFCEKNSLRHSLGYEYAHLQGQLAESGGDELAIKIRRTLGRSLAIRHVDAGSCNACDFEMSALLNPVYDITQYGIDFVASPRHADLLMVTGVVTRNLRQALEMTLEATPTPRLVMAVGACACSGRVFGKTYAQEGPVDKIVPVDIYVPGCPPRPQALIYGLLLALDRL
jgi:Ni,Fe-hydrogenase III small subunit/Pyruvate/2-oxoacid:ferredoxin oxidoreductase delta subunit